MSQIDEQRVLGILLSSPANASEIRAEWFLHSVNREVFEAILATNSADLQDVIAKAGADYASYIIGVAEQSWAPQNLRYFARSMEIGSEVAQFQKSLRKLEAPSGKGRMFAGI